MSRKQLRAAACVMCLAAMPGVILPGTAMAESIERYGNDRINSVKPKGLTAVFGDSNDDGSPAVNEIPAEQTKSVVGDTSINISQPKLPNSVQQSGQQAAPSDPVQQVVPQQPARPATRQAGGDTGAAGASEADWWKETGNPKVFAFRDCAAGHARAEAQKHPKVSLKSVLRDAIKGACKKQFDAASTALAARFGSERARKMAEELGGSTFVPAVREAVLGVRREQKLAAQQKSPAPQKPAPQKNQLQPVAQLAAAQQAAAAPDTPAAGAPKSVGPQLDLAIAKEEMFTCYRTRTDRAGPQADKPLDSVVDQVLLDCSDHTRAFFTRLFNVYPHPPARQADKMREVIATSYRPAIASRVQALRAAGAATATGGSGSSTVLKSATTSTAQ